LTSWGPVAVGNEHGVRFDHHRFIDAEGHTAMLAAR